MIKPKQLFVEELLEIWNDDRRGDYVQINDDGSVVEISGGCFVGTILRPGPVTDETFKLIRAWMEGNKFWPNIWSCNDHGNVTLHDEKGNDLGGLV